jgi:small subunit ribosomal protein S3
MEERKFINLKKEEFGIKTYIKRDLGKGKISKLDIEYTPVGEKIIISTSKPGLVIGRRGEKIQELTTVLKKRFKLENPHIEIKEIENPLFDAQIVADEIAMALERMGNLKFKVIAYRKLQEIMNAGALGCELRLSGKLPSERSRTWRFAEGYLKKAGESSKEIDRAQATALTRTGIIGIKVAIMNPNARIYDKIEIDERIKKQINNDEKDMIEKQEIEKPKKIKKRKIIKKKKKVEKENKKEPKKKVEKKIENVEKEIAKDITKTEDKVEEKKITQKQADKEIKEEVKEDIKELKEKK